MSSDSFMQKTRERLPVDQVNAIWESIKDMGVLVGKGGLDGNVTTVSCIEFSIGIMRFHCAFYGHRVAFPVA